jgi:hypothetical protein
LPDFWDNTINPQIVPLTSENICQARTLTRNQDYT